MRKEKVAMIAKSVVDFMIPDDVRQQVKSECPIMVDDLSSWDLPPLGKHTEGKVLLGIFGFENNEPIIGLNYRTLNSTKEVRRTTLHEIAHFIRWKSGLNYGERATCKLAKEWENGK